MKFLLVDGNNLAYRSHAAIPDLTNDNGFPTGGIYGFFTGLRAAVKKVKPNKIVVLWDYGKSRWRTALLPTYKADRKPGPNADAYRDQIAAVRRGLEYLGIQQGRVYGVEADDLISLSASRLIGSKHDVVIFSGDKDFLQLLRRSRISILKGAKGRGQGLYRESDFKRDYDNLTPSKWPYVLALMGDNSDGIRGIRGIGIKTAIKLMNSHDTLSKLVKHNKVEPFADIIRLNVRLIKLPISSSDMLNLYTQDEIDMIHAILSQLQNKNGHVDQEGFTRFLVNYDLRAILNARHLWVRELGLA